MEDEPHKNTKYAMDSPKSSLPVTGWVWDMLIGLTAREKKEQKTKQTKTQNRPWASFWKMLAVWDDANDPPPEMLILGCNSFSSTFLLCSVKRVNFSI